MPYIANEPMNAHFLTLYRKGDETAFQELYNRYRRPVYRLLWRYLGRHDLVEDTLQETFSQLYLSRFTYDNNRPLDAWLFKIAANKAKDTLRWSRQRPMVLISHLMQGDDSSLGDILDSLTSASESPAESLEQAEINEQIRIVIADLPRKLREILTLAYFKQLKYRQIADALDIPLGTVKSRLHTAVARFGQEWKQFCERSSVPDDMESKQGRMLIPQAG